MKDFQRLLKYLKPNWFLFILAILCMNLVAAFETATGALIVPITDVVFGTNVSAKTQTLFNLQALIPQDDWLKQWATISIMLISFTLLGGIAEYFSVYLMARIGQSAVLQLRKELYDHLLKQSSAFFEKHRTNFLVSRLVVSATAIELAVSANLRDVLKESFALVFFVAAAFYYNWRLMLGALIIGPIIALITSKFSKTLRRLSEEAFEGNKVLTDTAQESLSNQHIVKAYRAEKRESRRFAKVAERIAQANLRSGKISAFSPPTISLIGVLLISALLFFGLRDISLGRMEASEFFAFLFFLFRSYDPIRKISRQHNELNKAFAATRDIWNILDENSVLPEKSNAIEIKDLHDKIEFKNVSFSYKPYGKKVLDNVSLQIPRGKVIALVGESGSGKSSLTKLIQRLYDPTEGSILWDGIDLRDIKVASLRKQIALVTQETILFNDTIRYNISYGKPDATDEEIQKAAEIAYAHEFIKSLPQGYDTIVGERGQFLSGGQRQRIAIARAILLNAPVLILDEATSSLDAESEHLVQKALANLMKDKTSIIIAHRLATIRQADVIVVMEKGKIVEIGSHDELLSKKGIYKRFYDLQFQTAMSR
ncbi:MAG: ABC transporter ATP-binding protein/permease [Pyrinomonadaceae bacterium]|nr:ABC transporter ATP-binding protein/permease [Pyrinomonadaceae bacterium]